MNFILAILVALVATLVQEATAQATQASFCNAVPNCAATFPRDVVFLLDISGSMSQSILNSEVQDYMKQLFCAFDEDASSTVGLAVFGGQRLEEVIPLAHRSTVAWGAALDTALAAGKFQKAGSTPTAEGLELAHQMMLSGGNPNNQQIIFVITDGVPNPINYWRNDGASSYYYLDGKLPYGKTAYPFFCQVSRRRALKGGSDRNLQSSICDAQADYSEYLDTLETAANNIKADDIRITTIAVATEEGDLPQMDLFDGTNNYPTGADATCAEAGKFCYRNINFFLGPNDASCVCEDPRSPLASLPTDKNVLYGPDDWDVAELVTISSSALCQSEAPSKNPTTSPTTSAPTVSPTKNPTTSPTVSPTKNPTTSPTKNPTMGPTVSPTMSPTKNPTKNPTTSPTTSSPTISPTKEPTFGPTYFGQTGHPTKYPSVFPTASPTKNPTTSPTKNPTTSPTTSPTKNPTTSPTKHPTTSPTKNPTKSPTTSPTKNPTKSPTKNPTTSPTTSNPTTSPTTSNPTVSPTKNPTVSPTKNPTTSPTKFPTEAPTTTCTHYYQNPWESGEFVECCQGQDTEVCFDNFGNNDVYTFKCVNKGVCQGTSPNQASSNTCSSAGVDPYCTGYLVPCCAGTEQCLKAWDGDGRIYAKCTVTGQCANPTTVETPDDAPCAKDYEDPWQFGYEQDCCKGQEKCLGDWDSECRWFFKCVPDGQCGGRRRNLADYSTFFDSEEEFNNFVEHSANADARKLCGMEGKEFISENSAFMNAPSLAIRSEERV